MGEQAFRAVATGRGSDWISEGWDLFKLSPGMWIGLVLIWVLVMGALSAVPFIGSLASNLLSPVFTAGVCLGCLRMERGTGLQLEDLFSAFKTDRLGPLVLVGVFGLVAAVGIVLLVLAVGFGAAAGLAIDTLDDIETLGIGSVIAGVLLLLLLMLPVIMALWFAAPLVALGGVAPAESLKLSLAACWNNIWALTVWSLLAMLIMIVAAIPFLLGWLVAGPVLMTSYYRMYRDIFADVALPEAPQQLGQGA